VKGVLFSSFLRSKRSYLGLFFLSAQAIFQMTPVLALRRAFHALFSFSQRARISPFSSFFSSGEGPGLDFSFLFFSPAGGMGACGGTLFCRLFRSEWWHFSEIVFFLPLPPFLGVKRRVRLFLFSAKPIDSRQFRHGDPLLSHRALSPFPFFLSGT